MFEKQFERNLEINPDEIEDVLSDLEDKRDVIESVSDNLSDLKMLVQKIYEQRRIEQQDELTILYKY